MHLSWPTIDTIVSFATLLGVLAAFWQLRESKRQAVATFEDSLSAQYRSLLAELPVDALLGRTLDLDARRRSLGAFYRYFDLSNEQAFLRTRNRVGKGTWTDWAEGINQNMKLPAFQVAWTEIRSAGTGVFDDLATALDVHRMASGRQQTTRT
jgi:hypothetical protein